MGAPVRRAPHQGRVRGPAAGAPGAHQARPGIEARRAAELSELSLFSTHPPSGLRARVLAAQAGESAAVVLGRAQNARVDAELAAHSARSARTLRLL